MPKFDLKKITAISGKQDFYQLTINDKPDFSKAETQEQRNEKKTGVLDIYESNLEENYEKDMVQIYNTMQRVANNEHVPGAKYHELTGRKKGDPYKDYEFKHGDLRVYAIKNDLGKIIILAGFKNEQEKNIRKMRLLKIEYFESLNIK